jgi:hypothetical protein
MEASGTGPQGSACRAAKSQGGLMKPSGRIVRTTDWGFVVQGLLFWLLAKMLKERLAARGIQLPGGKVASDPKDLGQVITDLHKKPGQLRDILSDSQPQEQAPGSNPIIDMLSSPQAKAVLAGIAAMLVKRMTQGGTSQTT